MNANVAQLLLLLAGGISGGVALQVAFRGRRSSHGPHRRSFQLGTRTMRPHA
jgi:hypothetical protein